MGVWSEEQKIRLAYEEKIIVQELPGFNFHDRTNGGLTTVWGNYSSSHNNNYTIAVWIKTDFPYEMPGLYVTSPCPLVGYNSVTIQNYKNSHSMHTWESDWSNYVKICHYRSEYWSASNTILHVIQKGFLWLEAFEVHRDTGVTIDSLSLSF